MNLPRLRDGKGENFIHGILDGDDGVAAGLAMLAIGPLTFLDI